MPLDKGIYFCIKYYLYIIYLLYGWGKLVSSIQVQQGAKITPVPFEAGETLLSALRRAGYSIPAACGGKGRCGKCRVKVNGVPRLACKTKAQNGDLVDLPETMRGVILTDTLTLPKAQAGRSGLGAAVDLGTTTVALRLFDRADGKLLAQTQDWNAQAPYGADVISRIQHTMETTDGLGELSRCIRAQVGTLLERTLSAAGRKLEEVKELVIAGNTVMQHIFDGREVASIARAPFQPETLFEDGAGEIRPSAEWSDDLWFIDQENRQFIANEGWWQLQPGKAEGTLVGGNLGTFILLNGTSYRPAFAADTVLFIEDTGNADIADFTRNFQSLLQQPDFKNVKAVLIGRFQKKSAVTREQLAFMIERFRPYLEGKPVIANMDFGHSTPLLTIPVGGTAVIDEGKVRFSL